MRLIVPAVMTALVLTICGPGRNGRAEVIRLAQADVDVRMGPSRSPKVVIEEPRPPSVVIETEGRGEGRNCRPVTVTERQDGVLVPRTERRCGR
jgi:hypothetical protein